MQRWFHIEDKTDVLVIPYEVMIVFQMIVFHVTAVTITRLIFQSQYLCRIVFDQDFKHVWSFSQSNKSGTLSIRSSRTHTWKQIDSTVKTTPRKWTMLVKIILCQHDMYLKLSSDTLHSPDAYSHCSLQNSNVVDRSSNIKADAHKVDHTVLMYGW